MTVCPIAIAVGCKKCPIFKICPVKSTLGDYKPEAPAASASAAKPAKKPAAKKAAASKPKAKASAKPAAKKK
jgi:hypothetical protein